MKPTLTKQIIRNSFEGKTTTMQHTLIEEWLRESGNQELYFLWLEEWERENTQFHPDVDAGYARSLQLAQVSEDAAADELPVAGATVRRIGLAWRLMQWAAACVVVLGTGYLTRGWWFYQRYETGYGEVRTIRLPDNSRVSLNAHSVLTVPRFGFGSGTREVELSGEAEFAIQHLPDHRRFIVRTPGQLEVQVLGTEFVVYSRERGSKVVLSQGKVQLRSLRDLTGKPVIMAPGDVATLSTKGQLTLRHKQPVATHMAWKRRMFVFENTPVSEIAYQISEHFGVNVLIADPDMARRTLGGTFQAHNPDELLAVLADILNARISQKKQPDQSTETFVLTPAHAPAP